MVVEKIRYYEETEYEEEDRMEEEASPTKSQTFGGSVDPYKTKKGRKPVPFEELLKESDADKVQREKLPDENDDLLEGDR